MTTLAQREASSLCIAESTGRLPCAALENLPEELLQLIISHLHTADLKRTALISRTLHRHVTDLLWQNVCLVGKRTLHENDLTDTLLSGRGEETDEHDNRPMIGKLYILATKHHTGLEGPDAHTPLPLAHAEYMHRATIHVF
ncbi:hypothetical protein BU25DRAFT_76038 [Macroventuria anomochaeta]|uniref:Uncharacterized protein n=1 Tax=Macroventuria anomochaeta TaxID=301207 RepID=A0ACB6RY64_9PLEO|nr:uncharacterized protein BU25DRAFT_76038 [Macroventuria anomochaeta]KAF2626975.1 hypothetical protein BU25DRAFT_76038 [Macroventuria anomochaeta]